VTANSILAFSVLAALLTVLPGSDFAFTLRWALRDGPSGAFAAALGIAIGSLCWATASAVGLVELLRASRLGYDALRVTGAAYLVLIGLQSLRGSGKSEDATAPMAGQRHGERHRLGLGALASGVLNNLLNPKVGVFYLSVLPQFAPAPHAVLSNYLLLGGIHATLGVVWLTTVGWLADRARQAFTRGTLRRRLEQLTGVVLIAFGLRVAADHR
jgi:threonine/homoserine/homoserine lactone efflux protein